MKKKVLMSVLALSVNLGYFSVVEIVRLQGLNCRNL